MLMLTTISTMRMKMTAGISCCVYSSTQLIVIVCLSRQKTGPQREHTLPYDEEDDDEDDLQEFVETP